MKANESLEQIGKQILEMARTELYLSMPFMGAALNSLELVMDLSTTGVGTDAESIRYNPYHVRDLFLNHPYRINRAYMHMLLHCLFRHMFISKEDKDEILWDLSCEIAVESIIDSMNVSALERTQSDVRQEWYQKLKESIGTITAQKVYHYLMECKISAEEERHLLRDFTVDDHSFWKRMNKEQEHPNPEPESSDRQEEPPKASDSEMPSESRIATQVHPKEEEWKKHAKRVESEMAMMAKEKTEDTGSLKKTLSVELKRKPPFQEYLQKFSILREEAHIDLDSFDYGFYNYGMETYGNMPIIEENEFREEKKIEEFVIAIDTSASCQATLVQEFLNQTAAILGRQESFFRKVQIHLIECDNQIQSDRLLTDVSDLKKYADAFTVSGGYGTDFRPVFRYVRELQKQGRLQQLKGLLYFTDGFGIYPKIPTGYETAFVFWEEEIFEEDQVPDWAIRLYFKGDK